MKGYILITDILGFSNIVKNLNQDALSERIDKWINLIKKLLKNHQDFKHSYLSDTLFISVPDSQNALSALIDFSKNLLEEALQLSLPLRGGIAYGDYDWKEGLIYGKAVIAAHKFESDQEWIGIAVDDQNSKTSGLFDFDKLILYPVPFKTKVYALHAAISWQIPKFDDLTKYSLTNGLTATDEALDHKLMRCIKNTTEFRIYKEILKVASETDKTITADKFKGYAPIEIFEMNLLPEAQIALR